MRLPAWLAEPLLWALGHSSVWRTLSPQNRNHALVLATAAGACAVETVRSRRDEAGGWEAALRGADSAGTVFLAWAVARELDPDTPGSALVAMVPAALLRGNGIPVTPAMTATLGAVRLVVRSTGRQPQMLDLTGIPALAAAAALFPGGWAGGAAAAAALLWDTQLPGPRARWVVPCALATAAGAAAATAVGAGLKAVPETPGLDRRGRRAETGRGNWAVAAAGLAGYAGLPRYVPRSSHDRAPGTIDPTRLQAGRRLALIVAAASAGRFGQSGLRLAVPLWSAFGGIAFRHFALPRRAARRLSNARSG